MLLPTVPDEEIPWSMEGEDPQQLCVRVLIKCLELGTAAQKQGVLDPKEPGITKFEKIRRMQHQPIPMVFPQSDVQLGLNKVFMRKPPHDALEAHRVFHQAASATLIQCWVRGLEQRRKYLIFDDAVCTVQRWYRGCRGSSRLGRDRGTNSSPDSVPLSVPELRTLPQSVVLSAHLPRGPRRSSSPGACSSLLKAESRPMQ